MDSIGDKLRTTREEKGYTQEQAARDTNISRRYIAALEDEDFTVFPGETYLIGFLRNYTEFLGLSIPEMITLYKNLKIQEQPVPLEQLLVKRRSPVPITLIIIVLVILGVLSGGGYFAYSRFFSPEAAARREASRSAAEAEAAAAADPETADVPGVFELPAGGIERRFMIGESVVFPLGESRGWVRVAGTGEMVRFEIPAGNFQASLGEERLVDVNGDGVGDIRVSVLDIDISASRALLRFNPVIAVAADTDGAEGLPAIGAPQEASRQKAAVVLLEAGAPEPIQLNITFRGFALVRYLVDGKDRVERYFGQGDTLRIEAEGEIRLWISNAGVLSAVFRGSEIDLGSTGEVSTAMLAWQRNTSTGRFELRLVPMY